MNYYMIMMLISFNRPISVITLMSGKDIKSIFAIFPKNI